MAYIYKMTNMINGKIYIGQTKKTIEERIRIHISDSKKERNHNRPIYNAINQYGIENFSIEVIEEVDDENLDEREIYWIEYYDSFNNGYNVTYGGSGKNFIDHQFVIDTYKEIKCISQTAKICNCSKDSVKNILKENNVPIDRKSYIEKMFKEVEMFDKDGKYIRSFSSIKEATRFLMESTDSKNKKCNAYRSHISDCCRGVRKTCLGFKWKFK